MTKINFFTPVYYPNAKTFEEKAIGHIDSYFHICGKKAVVISARLKDGNENVILKNTKFSTKTLFKTIGIVLTYFTVIIPLIMIISKAVLRSLHSYKLIDSKKELEQGKNDYPIPKPHIVDHIAPQDKPQEEIDKINDLEKAKNELEKGLVLTPTTLDKINDVISKILNGEQVENIERLKGSNVFKHQEIPNLVFKWGHPLSMEERFENMIKAKSICLINNLGLLIIPHARKFTLNINGKEWVFIAEESMDIISNESAQEEFYHKYSKELNETARQLAIFIAKTGFNDVTPRNIPIINEAEDFHGPRRVAMIDLEHMQNEIKGFTGDANGSRGLLHCVSEEQIDIVIDEARKNGIAISDEDKKCRLRGLESDKKLRQFYENKGIVTGKEPIQVDVDSLGLDLTEKGKISVFNKVSRECEVQTVTLREVTEQVVAKINKRIQKKSDKESTKGKRYILLSTDKKPFFQYLAFGLPPKDQLFIDKDDKRLWFNRIIQALVEKGHVFKLIHNNAAGYSLQA